jgi:RND family efflux transporter MFP subunit
MKHLLLFISALLLAGGCGHHAAPPAATAANLPTAQVKTVQAQTTTLPLQEETVGTVRAVKRASVESKLSGLLLEMAVTQGQSVKAGERIARVDVREIQARLDQARAQQDQARRDLERAESLAAQNALPRQELDAARARAKVADAQVAEAETLLGHGTITAPFDGIITRKAAEQGDLASPGRTLVELEDPARLRLETDVPEALALRLAVGNELEIQIPSQTQQLKGTVAEISPVADPVSRTVRVKLDLPPAPGLRPGLFARARIPAGTVQVLVVPRAALVTRGQLEMVFVIQKGLASLRLVKSGRVQDERVEILSGLKDGETVATEGAAALRDGQPVEVRP